MVYREQIPVDHGIDNTFKILTEGYKYITNRREEFNSNLFETRVLGGQKTVCISGKEAAEIFYDNEKFHRQGAAPKRVLKTLFGEDGVQTLDGEAHHNRKALFMSLMSSERLEDMKNILKDVWEESIDHWEDMGSVHVYKEMNKLLTQAVCKWAGVPLRAKDLDQTAEDLNALFEAGGAVGVKHIKGRMARKRIEKWAADLIKDVRENKQTPAEDTALYKMTWHEQIDGTLMKPEVAAVELINILRPVVAVSVYVVFSALALYDFPTAREKLKNTKDELDYKMFVQEVRRYYPFFPVAPARVRKEFVWKGHEFKEDNLVLLDLYGTNHHPDLWDEPNSFIPERFEEWEGSPFDFIPQGGGDYYVNHRCAGEWLTIEIMKVCLDMMVNHMNYDVPKQNLEYSMTRMPSLPKSGFVIQNVKKK